MATVASCVLLIPLSPPWPAHGFGTIDGLGQHREHERITRAALACPSGQKSNGDCFEPKSIDQLAGKQGTFGAVGAPDIPVGGEVFNPAAHCDDADFLTGPYRRTRNQATGQLQACINHLRGRFREGVARADQLVNSKDRISKDEVNLDTDCTFAFGIGGRAKCNSLEGFGRALHGVQDFYSHSNWADEKSDQIDSVTNPPGLNLPAPSPLMDLRRSLNLRANETPTQLTTGCFVLNDRTPGVGDCEGRVTHSTLNKDKGIINPDSGAASSPSPTRGQVKSNFAKAVAGAITETKRQWADQRAAIVREHGEKRGALMVCALTRDDPVKDCQARKLGIVIDSSGSNQETDPANLRVAAAQAFNASLVTEAQAGSGEPADLSTVIDFDSSARVVSPLADPGQASFAGIDSEGGTNIGSGVSAAINELTRDPNDEPTKDRTGIVVLTDGMDSAPEALQAALAQAATLGIRVSFGFLSPPQQSGRYRAKASIGSWRPHEFALCRGGHPADRPRAGNSPHRGFLCHHRLRNSTS